MKHKKSKHREDKSKRKKDKNINGFGNHEDNLEENGADEIYEDEVDHSRHFREDEDLIRKTSRAEQYAYRMKEVDVSEIPNQLISHLEKVDPLQGGVLVAGSATLNLGGWIIQCPKEVPLRDMLKGNKISLNGTPTIFYGSDSTPQYEASALSKEDETENMFLLLPDVDGHFKMASIPLKGYIMVRHHIEDVETPEITIPRKRSRKLPSGIKERHPIYGVVSHSASLPKVKVTRSRKPYQLSDSEDTIDGLKLSFSKNKRNKNKTPIVPVPPLVPPSPKKSRKSKSAPEIAPPLEETVNSKLSYYCDEVSQIKSPKKDKKSKKRERDLEEVLEFELEVSPRKKLKKIKQEHIENYFEEETPHKSKKKRKSWWI